MEPQAPQLDLKDIHLPDAINWWPPAIGWWLLAILIPILCFFLFWLYKRITRKTAIKTAKKLILQIKQNTQADDKQKLTELSQLIRRVAISLSPRTETASLTGQAWLEYLDKSVTGSPFSQGAGKDLASAQYQKSPITDIDIPTLISVCEDWLKAQKENKK
jgi:hypothetical protein